MNSSRLRQIVSLLLIFSGAAFVAVGFVPPRATSAYDLADFGRLPVQYGTRVLPIDSVARNSLRLLSDRTELHLPMTDVEAPGLDLPALPWLLDVIFRPEAAARVPVFRVDHDELLGLLGREQQGVQLLSFNDLAPHFDDIQHAASAADDKKDGDEKLSTFDTAVSRLRDNLVLFQRLTVSFATPGSTPAQDLNLWQDSLKSGTEAIDAHEAGKPFDQKTLDAFMLQAQRFIDLGNTSVVGIIPPSSPDGAWMNLGRGALEALHTGAVNPVLIHYAQLGEAVRGNDAAAFNTAVGALQQELEIPGITPRAHFESFINSVEPFFRGALLYMFAFIFACVSWAAWPAEMRRVAIWLVVFGFSIQTLGLFARVYLTGYGIVTNLYSSALFVGWVAVLFGLILEWWRPGAIGVAVAAFIGFATLVIAHNLPFNGDEFELPQAVLATNLWLWTHVMAITIGYGTMFVTGALGIGYILAGTFTRALTPARARDLARLAYGMTCFAILFSFVGTMLGGIWADQSWGRFWGWDPKENGALLIVLWCAICLHARWGKLCSERTQMALAVGGNNVTAWSWFGVNLLGVGLHSYGFMQGTFDALIAFWISQFLIIGLVLLPERVWRSPPALARAAA